MCDIAHSADSFLITGIQSRKTSTTFGPSDLKAFKVWTDEVAGKESIH